MAIKTAIKFFITGLAGTVIDTLVLWTLKTWVFSSYTGVFIVAPAISFQAAMFNNYTISYFWVWKHRVSVSHSDFFRRLPRYNLSCVLAFGIKLLLLIAVERLFHLDVIICNAVALTVSGVFNFLAGEKVIFRRR